jgi:hypothetical protein
MHLVALRALQEALAQQRGAGLPGHHHRLDIVDLELPDAAAAERHARGLGVAVAS